MPFIPHTDDDVETMLSEIGVLSIDELFDEIPSRLKNADLSEIPSGISEMEMLRAFSKRAQVDESGPCFIGAGCYDHHIPAAVWDLASRGEFLTSYTPYQAEASQGTLQVIYEFQSMMTALTGLDVANASVYEGGSSLGESILMAMRANRKKGAQTVLVSGGLNPFYYQAARTLVAGQGIEFSTAVAPDGFFDLILCEEQQPAVVVLQQPNFYGLLEDVDTITNWAHDQEATVIAVVNPVSLGLLKAPGKWGSTGADIACGDGQSLGLPMASGGPSLGFMCAKDNLLRQMPGRIVGLTEDLDGNPGYTLTLQAREQHIRREKAKSNICTNQGLLVTAATIHLSLMGAKGLRNVAMQCHDNTVKLVTALAELPGVRRYFSGEYFHEAVLDLGQDSATVVTKMLKRGILAGYPLGGISTELANCILTCATEKRTDAEISQYCTELERTLSEST